MMDYQMIQGMEFRLQAEYGEFENFRLKAELHASVFIEPHGTLQLRLINE